MLLGIWSSGWHDKNNFTLNNVLWEFLTHKTSLNPKEEALLIPFLDELSVLRYKYCVRVKSDVMLQCRLTTNTSARISS